MPHLSQHILVDFYGCDVDRTVDEKYIEKVLIEASKVAGTEVITSLFHKFVNRGVDGVLITADSYYGIRTWAKEGYVSLDFYSTNEKVESKKAVEYLLRKFGATKYSASEIKRGDKLELGGQ